jgi:hypothetical protein
VTPINPVLAWADTLPDAGGPVAQSSPVAAQLDGQGLSAVVGDREGTLWALHLSDGSGVKGWPTFSAQSAPIDATPSVVPGPGGDAAEVTVGSGNAAQPDSGGYQGYAPSGAIRWYTPVVDPPPDLEPAYGVQASLTVAPLQGHTAVMAGSLDQEAYALDAGTGNTLPGWPFFAADSVFSTASVADLYGTGTAEIVEGGAGTAGYAYGQRYPSGGHVRVLTAQGALVCHADLTETVDSSPAVGRFLPGGAMGIVVGTGSYYPGVPDLNALEAFNTRCQRLWSITLDGVTYSSPALADLAGNGTLVAVEGTDNGTGGAVWAVNPATGAVLWHTPVLSRVIGSVVTADLTGNGYQDVLVPTVAGIEILDGRTGAEAGAFATDMGFQNSPLVTEEPGGGVGITVAGYNGNNQAVVRHYTLATAPGGAVGAAGSWPMFHHDAQLTGVDGPTGPAQATPACDVPPAVAPGYHEVASDGGVFSFGGAPYCGSTGGHRLNAPVVAMADAPVSGGYWLVASDGGVFSYGGAHFYGSTGALHLASPIVGIAPTPDGRGYWLVASDGGVFAFGDAAYLGSGAGQPHSAIVGLAPTADGQGYLLASRTGGVYTFGDASFSGSASDLRLTAPVVGVALDPATGGYWLVGADGAVYSFSAPFLGSLGGHPLAAPVVGLTPTADGGGYRLVAADGGVFCFGTAPYDGSMGGRPLDRPLVGAAGT